MKKIETLQELEAEVSRLKGINTEIRSISNITDIWFEIENISVKVLYEANELFGSEPYFSNGHVKVMYKKDRSITLFAISVPAIRTAPEVAEFIEAS